MADIILKKLSVGYDNKKLGRVKAIKNLSAFFPDALFNVIVGPSGCGKTTLLKCIAGILDNEGCIFFDNANVSETKPKQRNVSYVSQEYALYPHMTVFDNIAFPLRVAGVPRSEIIERVNEIAKKLDIGHCLIKRPRYLSGGQQQRVAVARAIIKRPYVCLFDEPLSNLDAMTRIAERRFIKGVTKKFGVTVIYVTHDLQEAMALADKLFVMEDGSIIEQGSPNEVFNSNVGIIEQLKKGAIDQ